jgi:hypothetical protein
VKLSEAATVLGVSEDEIRRRLDTGEMSSLSREAVLDQAARDPRRGASAVGRR